MPGLVSQQASKPLVWEGMGVGHVPLVDTMHFSAGRILLRGDNITLIMQVDGGQEK